MFQSNQSYLARQLALLMALCLYIGNVLKVSLQTSLLI
jgi:hypothetical protein